MVELVNTPTAFQVGDAVIVDRGDQPAQVLLGDAAAKYVGNGPGTVAAGDDSRINGAAQMGTLATAGALAIKGEGNTLDEAVGVSIDDIALGGDSSPLVSKFANTVHINDYSSLFTGVPLAINATPTTENFTTAIQTMINDISAPGAKSRRGLFDGCIYPTGTLTFATDTGNFALEMPAFSTGFLYLRSGTNGHLINATSTGAHQIAKVSLLNIGLDGNRTGQTPGSVSDCLHMDLSDSGSAEDAKWHVTHCFTKNALRYGWYLNGRGDSLFAWNQFSSNTVNHIFIDTLYDSTFQYNRAGGSGEAGLYIDNGSNLTLIGNLFYFTGQNNSGNVDQTDSAVGWANRMQQGAGIHIEHGTTLELIWNKSEDTLGAGISIGRCDSIRGTHVVNHLGSIGRELPWIFDNTQPYLEVTNAAKGCPAIFFTGDNKIWDLDLKVYIEGSIPSNNRGGRWLNYPLYIGSSNAIRSSQYHNVTLDFRPGHSSGNTEFQTWGPVATVMPIKFTQVTWQSGTTTRYTCSANTFLIRELGATVTFSGSSKTNANGTYTITGSNTAGTYVDVTNANITDATDNVTEDFYGGVTILNNWTDYLGLETDNYGRTYSNCELLWNGSRQGLNDLHIVDGFNAPLNGKASKIGITTSTRQSLTVTATAYQSGTGNTRMTVSSGPTTVKRGGACNVSGISSLMNGTFQYDTNSSGSHYVEVRVPTNLTTANDATGLSGTILIPHTSTYTTEDGQEGCQLLVYGESIAATNTAVITIHKYRESPLAAVTTNTETRTLSATNEFFILRWRSGAWEDITQLP